MDGRFETILLAGLVQQDPFARKVIPYLKPEYFEERPERIFFELVRRYMDKHNSLPSMEAMLVDLSSVTGYSDNEVNAAGELIRASVEPLSKVEPSWMLDKAEQFCQDRSLYIALGKAVEVVSTKKDVGISKGGLPALLQDALSVTFDSRIGHDFIDDAQARFEYYHKRAHKLPFDIKYLNLATDGGVENKTLNVLQGGAGGGKTLAMCHFAATNLMDGKNVLYITMEMAEEKIAQRIDANLLDIPMGDFKSIPEDSFKKAMARVKGKTAGKLIVKEYPTTQAGVNHFRYLAQELKIKKGFIPDVIYIDYLNLCASTRLKQSGDKTYNYVKSVGEELRGLAIELNVPIWTATQTNREGFKSSDPSEGDVSDSFGTVFTADFMLIIVQSEEMKKLGQIMFKSTSKNRYNDPTLYPRFVVGFDRARQRLYDVEETAQTLIDETDSLPEVRTSAIKRPSFEGFF